MSEIRWPAGSLIASVRRGNQVFIPHGQTVIQTGDTLVVVAEAQAREEVASLCSASHEM